LKHFYKRASILLVRFLSSGVTFDENLKKIKEQCVYQRLPLEAQSFENSLHIFNISENAFTDLELFQWIIWYGLALYHENPQGDFISE
jgi:hypothetical protein